MTAFRGAGFVFDLELDPECQKRAVVVVDKFEGWDLEIERDYMVVEPHMAAVEWQDLGMELLDMLG